MKTMKIMAALVIGLSMAALYAAPNQGDWRKMTMDERYEYAKLQSGASDQSVPQTKQPMAERRQATLKAQQLKKDIKDLQEKDRKGNAAQIADLKKQVRAEEHFARTGKYPQVSERNKGGSRSPYKKRQPGFNERTYRNLSDKADKATKVVRQKSSEYARKGRDFAQQQYEAVAYDDSQPLGTTNYWSTDARPSDEISYKQALETARMRQADIDAEGQKGLRTQALNKQSDERAEAMRKNLELQREEDAYNRSLAGTWNKTKRGVSGAYEGTKAGISRSYQTAKGYVGSAADWTSAKYQRAKEQCTDFYNLNWQEKRALCAANPGTTALAGAAAAGVVGLTVYAAYRGAMGLYNWWTKPKQLPTPSVSAQTTTQINAQDQAASAALDNATQN